MKRYAVLSTILLLWAQGISSEIRPMFKGFAPAKTTVTRTLQGASSDTRYKTSPALGVGAEFLAETEFSPFCFGGGIGFVSPEKGDSLRIAPGTLPLWATLSFKSPRSFNDIAPFAAVRAGWPMPLSDKSVWWESPANFMIDIGVGAVFTPKMGFELNYTYTSLEKSYGSKDLSYRVSTGKFGITVFMNFEIEHRQPYVPNQESIPEEDESEEPGQN